MITLMMKAGVLVAGDLVEVDRDEVHHLKVRRARVGDAVRLVDGRGRVGKGVLRDGGAVFLERVEAVPPPVTLTLAVGAGDRDRFGWLTEKCAELGVTDLVPLESERTGGVASRVRDQHLERLRRRGMEAIKQCGSAWAPVIHRPVTVQQFLSGGHQGILWLGSAAGAVPSSVPGADPVTILIGPEGGFTEGEGALAINAGFIPVRFGRHTLRFETAALAAAAQIQLLREVAW